MTDPDNDPTNQRNYLGLAALAAVVILAVVLFRMDPTPEAPTNVPATPPPGNQP